MKEPSAVPWWSRFVLWSEVFWCVLRGQVMGWSRHLVRSNGLCCVKSYDAMRCHGHELYHSSTFLWYKALLQYYSVFQIPRTEQYLVKQELENSDLCPVWTGHQFDNSMWVLHQDSSINSLGKSLYFSDTTLYCKVLVKWYYMVLYYLVLQTITVNLICTTKYYSNLK